MTRKPLDKAVDPTDEMVDGPAGLGVLIRSMTLQNKANERWFDLPRSTTAAYCLKEIPIFTAFWPFLPVMTFRQFECDLVLFSLVGRLISTRFMA